MQCTSFVLQVQRFDEFIINDLKSFLINDLTSFFDQRFDEFSIKDFAKFLSITVGTVEVCVLKNCLEFIYFYGGQVLSFSTTSFLINDLTSFDQRFHEILTSVCTVQVSPFRFC